MTIDPYACPRGHHSVRIGVDRIHCETCRNNGLESNFDRSELVDLREVNHD